MKRDYKSRLAISCVLPFIFLFLELNQSNAQLFTRALPEAWVSKAESIERRTWFRIGETKADGKSKADVFKRITGVEMPNIFYENRSIDNLIKKINSVGESFDHIKIYMSSYSAHASCPSDLSNIPDKTILLVFALAKRKIIGDTYHYEDIGSNFLIAPSDGSIYAIDNNCLNIWAENYYNMFLKEKDDLLSTIDVTDMDNKLPDGKPSDTKYLIYTKDNFIGFWGEERDYLMRKRDINITGVRVDFAQYSDKGIPNTPNKYRYRFHLQFEFIRTNGQGHPVEFYHEEEKNFSRRYEKYKKKPRTVIYGLTGNHGELCPKNCD